MVFGDKLWGIPAVDDDERDGLPNPHIGPTFVVNAGHQERLFEGGALIGAEIGVEVARGGALDAVERKHHLENGLAQNV